MGSTLSGRSDEENQKNLERFSPLLYQLKKSGESTSPTHSMKCDIVGQEPGCYPYPSGDQRQSPNSVKTEEQDDSVTLPEDICERPVNFKPKKLL
jgi:hypothetical protein